MSFFDNLNRKSACVFGKGGLCYFSHPDGWGGHAILSSRNRGRVNIFFLLRGAVCHPPPSAEIYEQSLMEDESISISIFASLQYVLNAHVRMPFTRRLP